MKRSYISPTLSSRVSTLIKHNHEVGSSSTTLIKDSHEDLNIGWHQGAHTTATYTSKGTFTHLISEGLIASQLFEATLLTLYNHSIRHNSFNIFMDNWCTTRLSTDSSMTYEFLELDVGSDDIWLIPDGEEKDYKSSWSEFNEQSGIASHECGDWMCIPMLWVWCIPCQILVDFGHHDTLIWL